MLEPSLVKVFLVYFTDGKGEAGRGKMPKIPG